MGLDFAEQAAREHSFGSAEEAIEARLASGPSTPRAFLEEEAREHLELGQDGRLRWRYCRPAVVAMYGELCSEPPPPTVLPDAALLVHASQFGLVRGEQLADYVSRLDERLEVVAVEGGHIVYWDAFEKTADVVEKFLIRHTSVTLA